MPNPRIPELQEFHAKLRAHFDLWRQSIDIEISEQAIRNVEVLEHQQAELAQLYGRLRAVLREHLGPLQMGMSGFQWDPWISATTSDMALRKGESLQAVTGLVPQVIGALEAEDARLVAPQPLAPPTVTRSPAPTQSSTPTTPTDRSNNPWLSGSFYLFAFVVIVGLFVWLTKLGAGGHILALIGVVGILGIIIIGTLQLRNDDRISDKSFVNLIREVLKKLPKFSLRK